MSKKSSSNAKLIVDPGKRTKRIQLPPFDDKEETRGVPPPPTSTMM